MHQLILEFTPQLLEAFGLGEAFSVVEEIQVMEFLRMTTEVVAILRVKFLPGQGLEELRQITHVSRAEYLFEEKETVTVLVEVQLTRTLPEMVTQFRIVVEHPVTFFPNKIRMKLVGLKKNLKELLMELNEMDLKINIISFLDTSPSATKNKNAYLTQKQENVLLYAMRHGYFEIPRAISTKAIAANFGITPAGVLEHIRKGQKKIFENYYA